MSSAGLGAAVLTRAESVQWLTGARLAPSFCPCAAIDDAGRVTLVVPRKSVDIPATADQILSYEAKRLSTMRDASEQQAASVAALLDAADLGAKRVACEFSRAPAQLTAARDGWRDLDAVMFRLRRAKHADELAMMRRANDANRAMYDYARAVLEPGFNELDLYNGLQSVAVRELGEPLTYFGQDFRACARGGPPRDRDCQAGELYILDLGVGYRGYYSDNARTLAVGGAPSDDQQRAWRRLADVFPLIEAAVRPGVRCRDVFAQVEEMLSDLKPWAFNHHLGHGVGLAPHEGPHLNPNWDDVFEPGDFFTAEPGLYHEELRAGIRLEQNYVVTESGVRLETHWPLGLT